MADDALSGALALNLAAPARGGRKQQVQLDPSTLVDEPMMGLAKAFSAFKDPWIKSMVKGTVEARMSRYLGYRVEIPDEEDSKLKALLTENATLNAIEGVAKGRYAQARSVLIDAADKAKAVISDPRALAAMKPEEARMVSWLGGLTDPLMEDPDTSIQVVQKLGIPLTKGDLSYVSTAVQTTAQAQQAKQAAELKSSAETGREEKSLIETDAFLGKTIEEGAKGEGQLGPEFDRIVSGVEKARDSDLAETPFFWMRDTDTDEAQGSAGIIDITRATREGPIGKKIGRDKATAMVIARFGKDVADQLEGLDTDKQGRLLATSHDSGIEPEAAFNLQTAIRMWADDLNMTPADLMKQYLGLNYTGLDDVSYVQELLKRTGGDEKAVIQFLREHGLKIQAGGK